MLAALNARSPGQVQGCEDGHLMLGAWARCRGVRTERGTGAGLPTLWKLVPEREQQGEWREKSQEFQDKSQRGNPQEDVRQAGEPTNRDLGTLDGEQPLIFVQDIALSGQDYVWGSGGPCAPSESLFWNRMLTPFSGGLWEPSPLSWSLVTMPHSCCCPGPIQEPSLTL